MPCQCLLLNQLDPTAAKQGDLLAKTSRESPRDRAAASRIDGRNIYQKIGTQSNRKWLYPKLYPISVGFCWYALVGQNSRHALSLSFHGKCLILMARPGGSNPRPTDSKSGSLRELGSNVEHNRPRSVAGRSSISGPGRGGAGPGAEGLQSRTEKDYYPGRGEASWPEKEGTATRGRGMRRGLGGFCCTVVARLQAFSQYVIDEK